MTPAAWILASYLIGAIPFSYLGGKAARGIDLREHGSGNLGATNAFRVLGAKVAVPVMILDVLKGFVPARLFPLWDGAAEWQWALAYGVVAILGHVFPVYMRFRGGKGVATGAGVFLALAPAAVGAAFVLWALTVWTTRMVSAGSIVGALTVAAALPFTERRAEVLALGGAIALFILYSHRANLGRILRGEEHRFGRPRASIPLGEENGR